MPIGDCSIFMTASFMAGIIVAISAISFVWLVKNFEKISTYFQYAKLYYEMNKKEKKVEK